MKVFLTGATGYVGSAVLARLLTDGHEVVAHARSVKSADRLLPGALPAIGDLTDAGWLREHVNHSDGVIHAASPNDATSGALDTAFLDAVLPILAGSDRPLVHTGGTWIHGSGIGIDENTPVNPPPIVAWRPAVRDRVRAAASDGIRTVMIAPANIYGDGGGIPAMLAYGPTTDDSEPALLVVGGDQHLANVHRADIAALYTLALTEAPAGSYYLGANRDSPTMTEIAKAVSVARGLDGRITREPLEQSRLRLGPFADAVLIDAQIDCQHAQDLGWRPSGQSLLDDLATIGNS
ncbi:MAG: NAD-dependent epimerase/dehydratase family protein [Solirubrobacteraceae bacterium]